MDRQIDRMTGTGLFCMALGVITFIVGWLVLYGLWLIVNCVVGGGLCLVGILLLVYSLYKHRVNDAMHSRGYLPPSTPKIDQQCLKEDRMARRVLRGALSNTNTLRQVQQQAAFVKQQAELNHDISDMKEAYCQLNQDVLRIEEKRIQRDHAISGIEKENVKIDHAISDLKKGLSELKEYVALHATSDDKDHEQPASSGQNSVL